MPRVPESTVIITSMTLMLELTCRVPTPLVSHRILRVQMTPLPTWPPTSLRIPLAEAESTSGSVFTQLLRMSGVQPRWSSIRDSWFVAPT